MESGGESLDRHVPEWLMQMIESILQEHAPAFAQMGWDGIDVVTVTRWDHGEYAYEMHLGSPRRPIMMLDLDIAARISPTFRAHPDQVLRQFMGEAYGEAYIDQLELQGVDDLVVINISAEFQRRLEVDGANAAVMFIEHEARRLQREFGGPKAWSPRVES